MKKFDIDSLLVMPNDELKRHLMKANEDIEACNGELRTSQAENDRLRKENEDIRRLLETIRKDLEKANFRVEKYNFERFVGKADNLAFKAARKRTPEERAEARKRKGVAGRKTGSRNFAELDLAALAEGNEPLVFVPEELGEEELQTAKRAFLQDGDEDMKYVLERESPKLVVREVRYPVYQTPDGRMRRSPSHAPIPHSPAGPNLLADLCFMKIGLGVPCYRLSNQWLRPNGFPFSPQLVTRWINRAADAMSPACDAIRDLIRQASVVHIDETPVRTLDAEDRIHGYVFVFSADVGGRRIRYLGFSRDRKTDIVRDVLGEDFRGAIVVDGYDGYDRFERLGMSLQRCWQHARRKFTDCVKSLPQKQRKGSDAQRIVGLFDAVFRDEATIRQIGFQTAEDRLRLRNDPARRKNVDDLVAALEGIRNRYDDGLPERRAAEYFLGDRDSFLHFQKDGRVPIDNSQAARGW